MSRKTAQWRKLSRQTEYHAERVMPKRAKSEYQGRTETCCRPMNDEKAARFMRIVGTDGNPPKGSTKSKW